MPAINGQGSELYTDEQRLCAQFPKDDFEGLLVHARCKEFVFPTFEFTAQSLEQFPSFQGLSLRVSNIARLVHSDPTSSEKDSDSPRQPEWFFFAI